MPSGSASSTIGVTATRVSVSSTNTMAPKVSSRASARSLIDVAGLHLVVGQVHRGDQVVHPTGRREQRGQDGDHQAHRQRPAPGVGDRGQLVVDDLQHRVGHGAPQPVHLLLHRRRGGDQAVERDGRDQGREDRQEPEEGHPAADDRHVVCLVLRPGPLEDLLPAAGGDLGGRVGVHPGQPARPGSARPAARSPTAGSRAAGRGPRPPGRRRGGRPSPAPGRGSGPRRCPACRCRPSVSPR